MNLPVNLDGRRFNATQTAAVGVVNQDTIFVFRQHGCVVAADYIGGQIEQGYLVGVVENNALSFHYCQVQRDGRVDRGRSECAVERSADGRLRIIESFEWESRPGEKGVNVFEELAPSP